MPPASLSIARIQRLLRSLSASRSALFLALDVLSKATSVTKDTKGKSKASTTSDDDEWGGKKKKRKVSNGGVRGRSSNDSGGLSSSPFRSVGGMLNRRRMGAGGRVVRAGRTYGASSTSSTSASAASSSSRTAVPPPDANNNITRRRTSSEGTGVGKQAFDAREVLSSAGIEGDTLTKALLLLKAYANILEATAGSAVGGGEKVPSLVSLTSRILGWGIEEAVNIEEDESEDDGAGDERGSRTRSPTIIELEDAKTALIEEWYEAVPEYCRRWVLVSHATYLLLSGLEDAFDSDRRYHAFLLAVLDTCFTWSAFPEAAKLYSDIISLSLTLFSSPPHRPTPSVLSSSPSTLPPTLLSLSFTIANLSSSSLGPLFTALETTLLSSSFSDRYFFSDFLSLYRSRELITSKDTEAIGRLVVLRCQIGRGMISTILRALDEDDEEDEREEEVVGLIGEILAVMVREVSCAMSTLLNDECWSLRCLEALAEVIEVLPASRSLSGIERLLGVSKSLALNVLGRELSFAESQPSLDLLTKVLEFQGSDEEADRHALHDSLSTFLLPRLTTHSLARLLVVLQSLDSMSLTRCVLQWGLERYDELVDLAGSEEEKMLLADLPLEKKVFEDMLVEVGTFLDVGVASIATQDPSPRASSSPASRRPPSFGSSSPPPPLQTRQDNTKVLDLSIEASEDDSDIETPATFIAQRTPLAKFQQGTSNLTSEPDAFDLLSQVTPKVVQMKKKRTEDKVALLKKRGPLAKGANLADSRQRMVRFEGQKRIQSSQSVEDESEDELALIGR